MALRAVNVALVWTNAYSESMELRWPAPAAAAAAWIDALEMRPRLYGAVLIAAGALLILNALAPPGRPAPPGGDPA